MSKIKLNLASGVSIEKPLINAFMGNNNRYVILDNEMNGSMGLPIILVCKLIDNKLVKIIDQNEWTQVKEYLKQIIAGNKLENIQIANDINADDVYYTQLTLPVPSFEALKNAYEIEANNPIPVTEVTQTEINSAPVAPAMPEPVMPSAPVTPSMPEVNIESNMDAVVPMMGSVGITPETTSEAPVSENIMPTPEVTSTPVEPVIPSIPVAPSMPEVNVGPIIPEPVMQEAPAEPITPVMPETPQITPEPVVPVMPSMPEVPTPDIQAPVMESTNVEPETPVTPTTSVNEPVMPEVPPVVESTPEPGINSIATENIFAAQKEAFLQACENMFDALVQKFEKELENKSDK